MSRSLRSPEHRALCELLIAARKEADLTQEEVADRLKRPQSFVAKYEGGERRVDVIEFIEVAPALRRDPCELFEAPVRAAPSKSRRRRRFEFGAISALASRWEGGR